MSNPATVIFGDDLWAQIQKEAGLLGMDPRDLVLARSLPLMGGTTLTFAGGPDGDEEARTAADGWKWRSALSAVDEKLRGMLKYEDLSEEVADVLQNVRDYLYEELNTRNLELP